MIVLGTNVLSALMQKQPDAQVVAWLDNQHADSIWISSIIVFEARCGLALLAPGQRRSLLQERFDQLLQHDLENRVLQFDADAAAQAAHIAAERKTRGYPVDMRDTFIVGVALAQRATLATHNTRHFADLNVPVVNPWQAANEVRG